MKRVILLVKPSPFQKDLFDLKYIEDQIASIKKMENKKEINETEKGNEQIEQNLANILEEQLNTLQKIHNLLLNANKNSKNKSRWLNF